MNVEICLSPQLLDSYDSRGKSVVVVDIFRASSAVVTAIAEGIKQIQPVKTLEEAHELHNQGYIVAAERNGEIVNGYKYGNSPLHYLDSQLKGKEVVFTTTNFTTVVGSFPEAENVLVGAFLNISSLAERLISINNDILIVCAGFKKQVNLEDSLFSGFLCLKLEEALSSKCDTTTMMIELAKNCPKDKWEFLQNSSHRSRLLHLNLMDDIIFCLKEDVYNEVPVIKNGLISKSLVSV